MTSLYGLELIIDFRIFVCVLCAELIVNIVNIVIVMFCIFPLIYTKMGKVTCDRNNMLASVTIHDIVGIYSGHNIVLVRLRAQ